MSMLDTLTQTLPNTGELFSKNFAMRFLRSFAAHLPTFYVCSVMLFGSLGYVALWILPVTSVWLYASLIRNIVNIEDYSHWSPLLFDASVMMLTTLASISLIRLSFPQPAGVKVTDKDTPLLKNLISELQGHFNNARINNIIITYSDTVRIVRIPRNGLPIRFINTLEIGLSSMLCTSPEEFRGMLCREIAKLASKQNRTTGWLLRLYSQWDNYDRYLARQKEITLLPYKLFFKYYSPAYKTVAIFAARRAEIRADRYMLEVMEDMDAVNAIVQTIIYQSFLRKKYWPHVRNQPVDSRRRLFLPYKKMTRTVRENITADDKTRWVENELREYGDISTTLPPLRPRLRLLGHKKAVFPQLHNDSAAETYLSPDMQSFLITSFDKSWLHQSGLARKSNG